MTKAFALQETSKELDSRFRLRRPRNDGPENDAAVLLPPDSLLSVPGIVSAQLLRAEVRSVVTEQRQSAGTQAARVRHGALRCLFHRGVAKKTRGRVLATAPDDVPLPDSLAIDAGNDLSGATTDQRGRGYPRPFGGGADIGAVEVNDVIFADSFD